MKRRNSKGYGKKSHGESATARMRENIENQLKRILNELQDLEEMRDELEDDEGFETLSVKMGAGLASVVTGELGRTIGVEEERRAQQGKMLNGRQMTFMICRNYDLPTQKEPFSSLRI